MLPLTDDNGNEVSDDDFPVNVLLRACCNQEVRLGNPRFSVCLDEVAKTTIILITIVLKCKAKGGRSCKSVTKPAASPKVISDNVPSQVCHAESSMRDPEIIEAELMEISAIA